MLPEQAIRHAEAALWLAAREYFASRMIALLNQSREYHRHYAALGRPINAAPMTLTGEAWIASHKRASVHALYAEPSYPGLNTVVFSLRDPEQTIHASMPECQIEYPHAIANCDAWIAAKDRQMEQALEAIH